MILGSLSEHRSVSHSDRVEGVQGHPLGLSQSPFISAQLSGPLEQEKKVNLGGWTYHEVGEEGHCDTENIALPSRGLVQSEKRGAFLAKDEFSGPVSDLEDTCDENSVHEPEAAEP